MRPIVSFTGSPTYNLSKEIARLLNPLVGNSDYYVRNSSAFANDICSKRIDTEEIMVSFDVVSLFTKIPVDLAVQVARQRLERWDGLKDFTHWTVEDICKGLQMCLEATHLTFRGKHFKQIFGTAMGSPVSAVVANLVMEDVEERAMASFADRPRVWKRYVDDTFVILKRTSLDKFFDHINELEPSIKFTKECEEHGSLAFLDVLVSRSASGILSTSVYRKPTQSGRCLIFRSDQPL